MENFLIQFFKYEHLPPFLQDVSKPFGEFAKTIDDTHTDSPEKDAALRKLLEAKDATVRSFLLSKK